MGEKNIREMSTEKMELVYGGVSGLSQEDVDTLASLLKMYSKHDHSTFCTYEKSSL